MAGLSVTKIKETIDGVFPLRTFCLSLALLILTLVVSVGVHQVFFAKPVEQTTLTGKTMAVLDLVQKIEDQPIQTIVEDPAPKTEIAPQPQPKPTGDEPLEVPSPEDALPKVEVTEPVIEDSIAGLSEETPFGSLPIVRESDGLRSFDAYKTPFKIKAETKGVISLVMVDYGLSDSLAKNALETLPAATTLIASPYSTNLQPKISGARSRGMEVWMGIPIQGTENPAVINMGPNTILAGLNTKENLARFNTHLGRGTGYAGVAFDAKTIFAEGASELRSIITAASTRGLGVAQLEPTDTAVPYATSQSDAPSIQGNLWIDTVLTRASVLHALADAEKLSLKDGRAVAVFHPSLLISGVIAEWQKSLAAKHIQLAPLTYAIHVENNVTPDKTETPATKESHKESNHVTR